MQKVKLLFIKPKGNDASKELHLGLALAMGVYLFFEISFNIQLVEVLAFGYIEHIYGIDKYGRYLSGVGGSLLIARLVWNKFNFIQVFSVILFAFCFIFVGQRYFVEKVTESMSDEFLEKVYVQNIIHKTSSQSLTSGVEVFKPTSESFVTSISKSDYDWTRDGVRDKIVAASTLPIVTLFYSPQEQRFSEVLRSSDFKELVLSYFNDEQSLERLMRFDSVNINEVELDRGRLASMVSKADAYYVNQAAWEMMDGYLETRKALISQSLPDTVITQTLRDEIQTTYQAQLPRNWTYKNTNAIFDIFAEAAFIQKDMELRVETAQHFGTAVEAPPINNRYMDSELKNITDRSKRADSIFASVDMMDLSEIFSLRHTQPAIETYLSKAESTMVDFSLLPSSKVESYIDGFTDRTQKEIVFGRIFAPLFAMVVSFTLIVSNVISLIRGLINRNSKSYEVQLAGAVLLYTLVAVLLGWNNYAFIALRGLGEAGSLSAIASAMAATMISPYYQLLSYFSYWFTFPVATADLLFLGQEHYITLAMGYTLASVIAIVSSSKQLSLKDLIIRILSALSFWLITLTLLFVGMFVPEDSVQLKEAYNTVVICIMASVVIMGLFLLYWLGKDFYEVKFKDKQFDKMQNYDFNIFLFCMAPTICLCVIPMFVWVGIMFGILDSANWSWLGLITYPLRIVLETMKGDPMHGIMNIPS